MPEFEIRQYQPEDEEGVWDLHERALRDIGAFDEEFAHLDSDLRNVEDEYLDAGGAFLVGELRATDASPELVAMGAIQPTGAVDHHESDPNAAVVRRMRVAPEHQRNGYGRRLLDELEARAAELGFERLVLDTTPTQESAIALYESFGYEREHRESTPAGEMLFYEKGL